MRGRGGTSTEKKGKSGKKYETEEKNAEYSRREYCVFPWRALSSGGPPEVRANIEFPFAMAFSFSSGVFFLLSFRSGGPF